VLPLAWKRFTSQTTATLSAANICSLIALQLRTTIHFDSDSTHREVEGEGVIGNQPEIKSGEKYQYISGCNLRTEFGKMHGTYTMENLNNKKTFSVNIPSFEMTVPFKLN